VTWTYDPTNLGTATAAERLDSVRFLVGDTDTNDQQVQDEEIAFALDQNGNNIYLSASWVARGIAAKFARLVDTDLDGQLSEKYSQLQAHYKGLSDTLEYQGKTTSGGLGFAAGGLSRATMKAVKTNTDRTGSRIQRDQFRYEDNDYSGEV
jgi:hypothetical protein